MDGKRYLYTVKRGDNLWDIGRHYGIGVSQLTSWNGISRKSLLKPGQKLTVWVKEDSKKNSALVKTVAKYNEVRKDLKDSVELRLKISEYLENKTNVKDIMKVIMKELGNE